jgi:hypothetical protein
MLMIWSGGGQLPLDIIDGKIAFAQRHGQLADPVADGGVLWAVLGMLEKGSALGGRVTELVTEHTEGSWGVSEVSGHLGRGSCLNEVGAEGLVLAVVRVFGSEEEARLGRWC